MLELTLSGYTVSGQSSGTVQGWVTTALESKLGFSPQTGFTHVLYILPQSVSFGDAAAYAYINYYLSVYLDTYSSVLLVQMHEIGHNLQMLHSGEGNATYGDKTGMMGAHVYQDDVPQMCFNAAKSWYTNWYADRHATVNPSTSTPWNAKLVGIDDYLNGQTINNEHYAVAKIDTLFFMYNRKEGVNKEVAGYPDLVTVIEQPSATAQSWVLAALGAGGSFTKSSWQGTSNNLVVKVCGIEFGTPDYARVMVY